MSNKNESQEMKMDIFVTFGGGGLRFKGVKRSKLHCGIMQPLVDCEGKETSGWKWIEMHRRCSTYTLQTHTSDLVVIIEQNQFG